MILGIGSDLVDIRRVERTLARFGERFVRRCFTEAEQARAHRRAGAGTRIVAGTYAKRYAAKEACAKALGTGLAQGVGWREIGVVNDAGGAPSLVLTGRAKARLVSLAPPGMEAVAHLTLTDEYPYAQAQVILSAVPRSS